MSTDKLYEIIRSFGYATSAQSQEMADAIAAAEPMPASEAQTCPACQGSGEVSGLDGSGPDAQEITANCPHCNGTGDLLDAYSGVVSLLSAERNKSLRLAAQLYIAAPVPASEASSVPRFKDHNIRQLVNDLRNIAIEFHAAGQLRARIADAVGQFLAAPAAPTDAKAYEVPTEAWLIEWKGPDGTQYREVLLHNAVGDYRYIDEDASSTELVRRTTTQPSVRDAQPGDACEWALICGECGIDRLKSGCQKPDCSMVGTAYVAEAAQGIDHAKLDERAAFEEWAKVWPLKWDESTNGFENSHTHDAWTAWQARGRKAGGAEHLLKIIGYTYVIAGAHDAPEHILDVLAAPEAATDEQVEAMLPYVIQDQQAGVPEGFILLPISPEAEAVEAIEAEIDSQLEASGMSVRDMYRQDGDAVYAALVAAFSRREG